MSHFQKISLCRDLGRSEEGQESKQKNFFWVLVWRSKTLVRRRQSRNCYSESRVLVGMSNALVRRRHLCLQLNLKLHLCLHLHLLEVKRGEVLKDPQNW